jgi:hypothetical protein
MQHTPEVAYSMSGRHAVCRAGDNGPESFTTLARVCIIITEKR